MSPCWAKLMYVLKSDVRQKRGFASHGCSLVLISIRHGKTTFFSLPTSIQNLTFSQYLNGVLTAARNPQKKAVELGVQQHSLNRDDKINLYVL